LNTKQYDSAYIELLYSYRALAYGLAQLIVITVIYRVENLYGTYSIVVTEENRQRFHIQFLLVSSKSGGEFVLQKQVK
jgi:hypothetical protein